MPKASEQAQSQVPGFPASWPNPQQIRGQGCYRFKALAFFVFTVT